MVGVVRGGVGEEVLCGGRCGGRCCVVVDVVGGAVWW